MTTAWRTVRVFISSTFRDMQAERDHLVRFVFPRLREVLARRRLHLVDVDLRWGVTVEQNALDLCLEEIDRCRPRFIALLGGRYGWIPEGSSKSITAAEILHGALEQRGIAGFRHFYFRQPAATLSVPDAASADYREAPDSAPARALEALKRDIGAAFPVVEYPCRWHEGLGRFTGLEVLGDAVYRDLLASVDAEFGPESAAAQDELDEERAAVEAFVENRVERYVVGARRGVLEALCRHATARDGNGWLCLVGEPGTGKSALLGRFWRGYLEGTDGCRAAEPSQVIAIFVGATPASTTPRAILRRLGRELGQGLGADAALPDDLEALRAEVAVRLEQLAQRSSVLIIVDAVNQLEAGARGPDLRWLPETLPAGARVIVSTLPGPALELLRARHSAPVELPLDPVAPTDASAIVDGFLERYRKALDQAQRNALLAKTDAGRPLYLLAALEELRTLGGYEEISERIRTLPGETIALFDWVLARLEAEPGFRGAAGAATGRMIVGPLCACLAASRAGMMEAELAALVAPGRDRAPADELGNVAALLRLLRPYLMRRGDLLDFFHGQLREAVERRYLSSAAVRRDTHRLIAEYFAFRADPERDGSWSSQHVRGLSELPYHQTEGELWEELGKTLSSLEFVEAKCTHVGVTRVGTGDAARAEHNGVYELQDDYRRALEKMPA